MSTNEIFSKEVLRNIINGNLDTLRQCIEGTIYQQWTAIILLMQFIEYVLKYKIQCAGEYAKTHNGKHFPRTHKIKELYKVLTKHDRKSIEKHFCKLIDARGRRDKKSFNSIKEFARRYNKAYLYYWRYDRFEPNFKSDEKYFYIADTVTVLRALVGSTDLDIGFSLNEDDLEAKISKQDKNWIAHS